MAIQDRLRTFLDQSGAEYELKRHLAAATGMRAAEMAHVSGECVVKGVLVEHGGGEDYRVVVLPATRHIDMPSLHHRFGDLWGLATEEEIRRLFPDCEPGMVPVPATAYGIDVLIDESLGDVPRVYFEVGDATTLVRMDRAAFLSLFPDAERGRFGRHM